MKKKPRILQSYLLLVIISTTIWGIIFAIKSIFPFGDNSVVYSDFGELILPMYYHLYDFLHGEAALHFSWNVGMGIDVSGLVGEFSLLSPFNLLFFFVPRRFLYSFMGIYTVIKAVSCSLSMHYFLKRRYSIPFGWDIVLSLIYEFSACVFLYYQLSFIVDIAFLFPILMKGFYDIWEDRGTVIYTVILTIIFGINIYIAVMVAIFLCTYSLIISINEKKVSTKWIIASIWSVGISAIFWFWPLCRMLNSGRMSSYSGTKGLINVYIEAICNEDWGFAFKKYILINTSILWLLVLYYIKSLGFSIKTFKSKMKSRSRELFAILGILIVSVIIPGIELLWHMGSRLSFPVRYVFIVIFILIECAANSVYENLIDCKMSSKTIQIIAIFIVMIGSILWGKRWISPTDEDYRRNDFLIYANDMSFYESIDPLVRYKEETGVMQANYSLIMKNNSIGQYVHIVPQNLSAIFEKIGYTQYGHKTGENGGTIFSDLLLGVDGCISSSGIHEYDYAFPDAILVKEDVQLKDNVFDNQNLISNAIANQDVIEIQKMGNDVLDVEIDEKTYVYLWGECEDNPISIKVNGKIIDIPSWNQWNNNVYPAYYNSGIQSLGVFSDETVSIETVGVDYTKSEIYIGMVRENSIRNISSNLLENDIVISYDYGKHILDFTVSTPKEGIAYIPIIYDDNWNIYVNGEQIVPVPLWGGFVGIPISAGNSRIVMNYFPNSIIVGSIITIVFILIYFLYKIYIKSVGTVLMGERVIHVIYYVFGILFIILMYTLPLVHFMYIRFVKLLSLLL